MKNSKFKLCILSAGQGSRNTTVAGLHKSLLPIENRAVISKIIRSFSKDIEIVIALGFKSYQVKSYLKRVFPSRKITYVHVENFSGPGSGPGLSLLQCEKHLRCPFIFTSSDTIVEEVEKFSYLDDNWIGTSIIESASSSGYCLIKGEEYLDELYYGIGNLAYNGMAGVYDYKTFWDSLREKSIINDEYQVIHGFYDLKEIRLNFFTWHDTGNNKSYDETRKVYNKEVVAPKNDETIFIENETVIKYFHNPEKVKKRLLRVDFLNNSVPEVELVNDNMYSYKFIEGETLSQILDENVLKSVLDFYMDKISSSRFEKSKGFLDNCNKMYKEKLFDRISLYSDSELDKIEFINGIKVEPIQKTLSRVNWESIYKNAIPSNFHGDFQPENIIYDGQRFQLIDWRESFGESLEVGDTYYDLGKLYHALLINGQMVLSKHYDYKIKNKEAFLSYKVKSNLLFLLIEFEMFCVERDLDWSNVKLLGILQYIGICSLYEDFHGGKYGDFLFLLGKYLLSKHLKGDEECKN